MDVDARIPRALLRLRLSVFLVMLMWTLDKLRPLDTRWVIGRP